MISATLICELVALLSRYYLNAPPYWKFESFWRISSVFRKVISARRNDSKWDRNWAGEVGRWQRRRERKEGTGDFFGRNDGGGYAAK